MAKRFELIVFDWDGTLMDSAAAIVRAIQAASADLGLPVPPDARARHVIGLGLQDALRALFTQPPMPIKCAGAPQKAMYLACDHWRRAGVLRGVGVEFHTAGAVLFGVPPYVAALMRYVERR